MKVKIIVEADIELVDEAPPAKNDPLAARMRKSALEGVEEALNHAMNRGFNHDLADLTTLCINFVKVARK